MSDWIKEHRLLVYFALAYAFSWAVEIPIALSAQGVIRRPFPYAIHYLASFGPFMAAVFLTGFAEGGAGIRNLLAGGL